MVKLDIKSRVYPYIFAKKYLSTISEGMGGQNITILTTRKLYTHVQGRVTMKMLGAMHRTQPYVFRTCTMWYNQTPVENLKMPFFGNFWYFWPSFHDLPDFFTKMRESDSAWNSAQAGILSIHLRVSPIKPQSKHHKNGVKITISMEKYRLIIEYVYATIYAN